MPNYGPYISKITLPNGSSYDIKDQEARELISQIAAGGLAFKISTSAASTPEGITWINDSVTVTGTLPASADTKAYIYLVPHEKNHEGTVDYYREYVTVNFGTEQSPTWAWEFLGDTDFDLSDLGTLAYKDSAAGNVTISTADSAAFSNGAVSATATYTPAGGVSSSFTGSEMTSTGSVKATGSVSKPSITVTPTTTENGASKLKTAGSVTAGTAPSFSDGTFNGGSFTQGTDQFVAPTLTTTVDANETLTIGFTAGSFTQGNDSFTAATRGASTFNPGTTPSVVTLPTFDNVDLLSGVSAELAAAPTFTGNSVAVTVTGTPEGSVSSSFSGTQATINSSGTATGDVSLTKTDKTKTVTVS